MIDWRPIIHGAVSPTYPEWCERMAERVAAEHERALCAAAVETHRIIVARTAKLEAAMRRLGSMEAMCVGGVVDPVRDAELIARIDYARAAVPPEDAKPDK